MYDYTFFQIFINLTQVATYARGGIGKSGAGRKLADPNRDMRFPGWFGFVNPNRAAIGSNLG
jgi:hypothetical protein